jgi:hypothetical protein
MGLFVEKASHHAGCFEFVKANKFGKEYMITDCIGHSDILTKKISPHRSEGL